MGYPSPVGPRFYFPIYSRRPYRYCPGQLLPRYCAPRHILRSSPLPLRPIYGGRLRYYGRFRTLIPPIYGVLPARYMNKNPFWCDVCRCQPNLLPPTLPRAGRNATSLLRLPRCLYPLKYSLFDWVPNLSSGRNYVPIHYLGSIRRQT